MNLRVIIVDDEQPARDRLARLLSVYPTIEIIAKASDGQQALEMIKQQQPDLIFLDISMPVMNGMQLAAILSETFPQLQIIFTTAYDEYALQAFEVNAQDYLLKPIRPERLTQALKKLAPAKRQPEYLTIKDRDVTKRILVSDIICLHADQKYTEIHLASETYLCVDSLKELEQRFADTFMRLHRSTLVNRNYLMGIEQQHNGSLVALIKNCSLKPEISRRHQPEIRQFLQNGN
ncbi:MAG: response regulator [Kangiellaceae bacterium]|nr:response regulator [Kangiellaceae bacterium]